MQVSVSDIDAESVTLSAPLAPNINHRETVFGGSASAVAILSAWALLHTRLRAAGMTSRVVIQRNTMEYQRPIAGAFTARATLPPATEWTRFLRMLERKGRARISASAILEYDGETAGRLNGERTIR